METPVQNEVVFYQDSMVKVTQSRFITNSKTYAMRNISSVHLFEIVKSRKLPGFLLVVGFFMLFAGELRIAGVILMLLGGLILIFTKNDFAVRISTNSGEANSIISKDRGYVQDIVDALNEAIIHRG